MSVPSIELPKPRRALRDLVILHVFVLPLLNPVLRKGTFVHTYGVDDPVWAKYRLALLNLHALAVLAAIVAVHVWLFRRARKEGRPNLANAAALTGVFTFLIYLGEGTPSIIVLLLRQIGLL